ncbi:helix-turn-helix domain-containing protein [Croceicoccus ponticola]|uniref:Helix-turn-helix domain-containing protein n=1 Tax=Croceicoccus ponticola TaxID=2217664 RepID=A0A437GYM3_9SPHN|nr:helix-turn-helix domain-containing protein [Croceicoccus ponticola]RVQ67550.1 helix-turn-helix domain-containing protein [Croceicoccus ponticola]
MNESENEADNAPSADGLVETAPAGIGAVLMAERERQGLSREDIGVRTRIAERHLKSIEDGRFDDLPGRTYAFGFARSYARALGLDEEPIVDGLRDVLGATATYAPVRNLDTMEPGDPARIPSSALAWGVAALFVVIVVGGFFIWRGYFMPASELPALEAEKVAASPAASAPATTATPAAAPTGDVTFTATADGIWVKFYDRSGRQLMQKQMALNETFTIPADADGPQLWTGRPDALKITIGGKAVAPLATGESTVKNVPVDAASLTARKPGPGLPERRSPAAQN